MPLDTVEYNTETKRWQEEMEVLSYKDTVGPPFFRPRGASRWNLVNHHVRSRRANA